MGPVLSEHGASGGQAAPGGATDAGDTTAANGPASAHGPGAAPSTVLAVGPTVTAEPVVVDVLDTHGRLLLRQRLSLAGDRRRFTIGRSVAADVLLDDPHVAPLHAAVDVAPDGTLAVTDLGSVNGVFVGGDRHRGATALPVNDGRLQIGRAQLVIHTAQQALPGEKPDHAFDHVASRPVARVAVGGALFCLAFIIYFAWVGASRDTATLIVIGLAGGVLLAALWIAFWSLLSRVIRGESRWVMHAAILFGVSAVLIALDWMLDLARFAFALREWPLRGNSLMVLMFMLALYLHLTQVWIMPRRTALTLAALLPLFVFGTISWVQYRNESRDVNFIGVREKVFPPVFRLREGRPVERFFEQAADLREQSDSKRREIPSDDNGDADDD